MTSGGQGSVGPEPTPLGSPAGRSLWSAAYGPLPIEIRAKEPGLVLIDLENSFLRRLVSLQATEARLWREANRLRGRAGRRAIRQIERERQRLGRELHTGVGQMLAAIRLQVELIDAHLSDPPEPVREALDRVGALAAEALDLVRNISKHMHPPEWQRLSIDAALRQLWGSSGVAQRFRGAIDTQPLPRDPDPEVKTLLYRGAQEALANIMRHSQATRVDLQLSAERGQIRLSIQDNGVGFDTARILSGPPDAGSGIGLRSIREQALDVGGKLLVRSSALGTTLEIFAPLES